MHKLSQRGNVCEYYFMGSVICTNWNIIIPMMAFSSYKTQGIAFPQLYNLLKDIIKCHLFVPMECTAPDQDIDQLDVLSSAKLVKHAFSQKKHNIRDPFFLKGENMLVYSYMSIYLYIFVLYRISSLLFSTTLFIPDDKLKLL